MGIYAFPTKQACQKSYTASTARIFNATISKYDQKITHITVYHCQLLKVTKICSENFWASEEKSSFTTEVKLTDAECLKAARTKTTQYGQLKKLSLYVQLFIYDYVELSFSIL